MAEFFRSLQRRARLAIKAAHFIAREPSSAFLTLRMGGWVILLTLLIKILPLPRAMSIITPRTRHVKHRDENLLEIKLSRLLDRLLATDFWIFTPTCWKRAPVLYRYLLLHGIQSRVVFGVRRDSEGMLDGHSWLEAEGKPLLEAKAPDYAVTFSYPV